jgi:hypothetical protein
VGPADPGDLYGPRLALSLAEQKRPCPTPSPGVGRGADAVNEKLAEHKVADTIRVAGSATDDDKTRRAIGDAEA